MPERKIASPKATTRKLSGPGMEHLFRRVLAEGGLDTAAAERLARRLALVLSSVRARRIPLRELTRQCRVGTPEPATMAAETATSRAADDTPPASSPVLPPVMPEPALVEAPARFDPYQFGLVPVFQREGRDGLLAKLAGVQTVEHLRAMARAQQIVLPAELRAPEASADAVRAGIATAVEKRIADRRAAAS